MDLVFLSRFLFGFNITVHYLFPPMSIGLGLVLVIMEGIYLKTKKPIFKRLVQFWTKIFSLFFAMGVATGLVQVFAFGNNWARFSEFVGDVFGTLLAAEGVFAFFLEAGFLGVMLFGWDRVKPSVHYLSTILVTAGAHFSAIWIVFANSWMQTPAGFKVVGEGRHAKAVITNIWDVYLNPSSIDRLTHVILGCWITGAFLLLSVGAYYLLRKKFVEEGKLFIKIGVLFSFVVLILQFISADGTARGVSVNQPEKFAALEGVYKTVPNTPITAFGWVDAKNEQVHGIKIPGLLSFLTYRNFHDPVKGLDQFPKENRPNVPLVFQTYHIMIAMWSLMMLISIVSLILWKMKKLEKNRFMLWVLIGSVALPYIANIAGWYTAEFGRQPWLVYNVLKTADAVSPSVSSGQVLGSIIMFAVIYALLLSLFFFLLNRKIKHGPVEDQGDDLIFSEPKLKQSKGS
ncbi:MAG: cytochrome ubiquinol oxidase subunit I [Chlamydiales bacterium]|nr:cytochrome ubiquinol oxidase subunit I [Chlamydiales bacterium]